MGERYDIVVIGGGPAGLMAARAAAAAGTAVLLLEKDPEIGYPVHCAEGVTRHSFDDLIEVRPSWVRTAPKIGRLVSPGGFSLDVGHAYGGYVLDRPTMEQDLAADVLSAGGEIRCGWRGVDLNPGEIGFRELTATDDRGSTASIQAKVFIAADGVESSIARSAGIGNGLSLANTESYLEYRLIDIEIDPNIMEIHLGEEIAPRSYAWVFPVSATEANVGLGIPSHFGPSRPIRGFLDRFVTRRFGRATVTRTSCGAAVRYQGPNKLARDNLLVVGDAARLLDSLTGGGILTAMISGQAAGAAAARFVNGHLGSLSELQAEYPGRFVLAHDTELSRMVRLKEFITRLDDSEIDDLVSGLADYFEIQPVESIDPWATLLGVIRKKPRILRIARHLFF